MTTKTLFALSGSSGTPSNARTLVETIVKRAVRRYEVDIEIADLGDVGPSLYSARRLRDLDEAARALVDRMAAADALVVATPVYKGSYPGLFKHLFDLVDPAAFAGKPVLLAATGGGDRHGLVVEHQLRPLFSALDAASLPTGVYASERDFAEGDTFGTALSDRIDRAVAEFGPHLLSAPDLDPVPEFGRFLSGARHFAGRPALEPV